MAEQTNTFDIRRALNGTPVGVSLESGTTDETSQLTGIVKDYGNGIYKTIIDGHEITLKSDGKTTNCVPADERFYIDDTVANAIYLELRDEELTQTYGNDSNTTDHTRSGMTDKVVLTNMEPRDEFATQVLGVMLQKMDSPESADDSKINYICRAAYRWANGMMVAAANSRIGTIQEPVTPDEVTVNQSELQSASDKLLYNLALYIKKLTEDGLPVINAKDANDQYIPFLNDINDIKKIAGNTIYKGIPIVGDGTTANETKPVLTKLDSNSEIKKIAELTGLSAISSDLGDINNSLGSIDSSLGSIDSDLSSIDSSLGTIDTDLNTIDGSIGDVADAISNQNSQST